MRKMINGIAAVLAVSALMAGSAFAADKLIVKDATGTTDVFKVDDAGIVTTTGKLGVGTSSPFVNFHLHVPGAATPAGTALYNATSPFTADNQNSSVLADYVVADGTGTAGNRGAIRGIRARGTLLAPTVPLTDDVVFSVLAGIWDGAAVRNTADVNFSVDGAVSSNIAPARIAFRTKPGGTGAFVERLVIKNDGKIGIGTNAPTSALQVVGLPVYADNAAATAGGLTAGAFYRTATGVLMVRY